MSRITRLGARTRKRTVLSQDESDDKLKACLRKAGVSEKTLARGPNKMAALRQLHANDEKRRGATQKGNDEKTIVPGATKIKKKAEKIPKQKVQKKKHDQPQKQKALLNGLI